MLHRRNRDYSKHNYYSDSCVSDFWVITCLLVTISTESAITSISVITPLGQLKISYSVKYLKTILNTCTIRFIYEAMIAAWGQLYSDKQHRIRGNIILTYTTDICLASSEAILGKRHIASRCNKDEYCSYSYSKKLHCTQNTYIIITARPLFQQYSYSLLLLEEFLGEWYVCELVIRVRVKEPLRYIHRVVDGVV